MRLFLRPIILLTLLLPFSVHAAFRSSTSGLTSASPVVATAPAGLASADIIFICLDTQGDTPTWPSGFSATFATFSTTGATHGRLGTYVCAWKRAGGSEPGSYSISMAGGSGNYKWVAACWSGRATTPGTAVTTVPPTSGNGASPFNTSMSITGYTATAGDDVAVFIGLSDTNTAGSWAISNAISFTAQVNQNDLGTFRGGELHLSTKDNISSLSGPLVFTATGTSLVASSGGDTAGVFIPLPAAAAPVVNGVVISNGHPIRSGNAILVH